MWKLAECDVWRDGGSYSATLSSGERIVSLWLQVSAWQRLEDRTYEALFESDGPDASLKSRRVPPGGPESEWARILETDIDRSAASVDHLSRLDELVAELRARCG
jgi:hypothetical protein